MALPEIKLDFGDSFENALARRASADYYGQRARSEAAEDQRKAESQQYVEPAMRGDSAAMAKLAFGNPQAAAAMATNFARMDATQRAQTKERAEFAASSANAILQADPADRAAIFEQQRAEGQRRGYDMSHLPPAYHPGLDPMLRSTRLQGLQFKDWYTQDQQNQRNIYNQDQQNQRHDRPAGGSLVPMDPPPVPPQGDATPYGPAGGLPAGNQGRAGNAIAGMESGGQPGGGYRAVGPVADSKGSRAYGKYQVMDFNIPAWTQEILGRQMTPQEFVASPEAQEAVFAGKFGQYVQKYGSQQAAARAWFAGEGGMNNPGARDVNGMTVARYEQGFNRGLGGDGGGTVGGAGVPPAGVVPSDIAQVPPDQIPPPAPSPVQPPTDYGPAYGQEMGTLPGTVPSQGDDVPARGDGSGNPVPPTQQPPPPNVNDLYKFVPKGWRVLGKGGQPAYDHNGRLMVQMPNGQATSIEIPKAPAGMQFAPDGRSLTFIPGGPHDPETERRSAEAKRKAENPNLTPGPFAGNDPANQARNIVLNGDPSTPQYAAAHSILTAEQVTQDAAGNITRIKPDISSWARPPTFRLGGAPSSAEPQQPAPSGGSKTVTVEQGKGKPLDMSAVGKLGAAAKPAQEMAELVQSFDPSFGGYVLDTLGDAANAARLRLPDRFGGGDPTGQGQWWQRYSAISNIDRNELFGASLTPGEVAEWKKATVTPGMRPDEIAKNIARQRDLAEKALSRMANSLLASGYNREAIEAATGIRIGDLTSPMGSVPQPRPGGTTPASRPPLSSFER